MPKVVTKTVLKKKGDCVFRRDGPLLALKWQEKKRCTHVEYNTRSKFCGNLEGRQKGE